MSKMTNSTKTFDKENSSESIFTPLSIFLALRYVRSRQGQGFSTFISASSTIGIALGTMILIVVLSAMNGFERELANKLLKNPASISLAISKPAAGITQSAYMCHDSQKVNLVREILKSKGKDVDEIMDFFSEKTKEKLK